MARLAAIDINFDSLGWAFSLSRPDFRDPTYFGVADRFLALAERFGFKYTIFVIGQDLENPEVAARVRDWHQQGHEIGNHSWHHHANLGALHPDAIEREVMRAHERITEVCGAEPRGFIAPAWSTSGELLRVLDRHDYLYDTSQFSSYVMWLIATKLWWNFRGDPRQGRMMDRRDWLQNLTGRIRPFVVRPGAGPAGGAGSGSRRGIVVLPLPVVPLLRLPCWHTLSFFLPPAGFRALLRRALRAEYFYYLVHPADLMDRDDLRLLAAAGNGSLERIETSLDAKREALETWLVEIKAGSQRMVTLREIAEDVLARETALA